MFYKMLVPAAIGSQVVVTNKCFIKVTIQVEITKGKMLYFNVVLSAVGIQGVVIVALSRNPIFPLMDVYQQS